MNYTACLNRAMAIFNEQMGADFSAENVVLACFDTGNQVEVFGQFCKACFPYRLADRYKEEGYFDFRASAFIGKNTGDGDGFLLRTDIDYAPGELNHGLLHELAHIFCAHNELGGRSFYDEYCEGYAPNAEEDGFINAGYAVWRECIAEIIAFECDDNLVNNTLRGIKPLLRQLRDELIDPSTGKLIMSEMLTAIMTSREIEGSATWEEAEKQIRKLGLLNDTLYMELLKTVFTQLRTRLIEIDIDFIYHIGYLYLNILSQAILQRFRRDITARSE